MTEYPLNTLPGLPLEAAYEIFSKLNPEEAANLCATSREFRIFCEERRLRINSMINSYLRQGNHELSFLTILKEGRNRGDVEYLEALLRLHPEWLNTITVKGVKNYTLLLAGDPLIMAALLELGSDPMTWYTSESVADNIGNYKLDYVKDKSVSLIYYLASPPGQYTSIPLLSLCLRLGKIPSDLLTAMIADTGFGVETMYAYLSKDEPGDAKFLNNFLKKSTYRSDYLDCRVLLEMGANPLSPADVSHDGRTLTILESAIDDRETTIALLMFHYTPLDMKFLANFTSEKKYQKLMTEAKGAANRIGELVSYSYPSLFYAYSQRQAPYWNDLNFWGKKWKLDLPKVPIPLTNNGAELRLLFRSEITKAHFDLTFKDKSGIRLIPANPPKSFEIRVASNEEITGLLAMLELLNVFQGEGYEMGDLEVGKTEVRPVDIFVAAHIQENTVTTLPWRNYVATFNRTRLQFDSVDFLEGAITACRLLGYEPQRYIRNLTEVDFD